MNTKNLSGMLAELSVILDTRRIKSKTSKYPLKLRVTYDRKSPYYPTIYDLKEEEFAKLGAPNTRADLKVIRGKLKEIERSAETAARDIFPFSFADFEKQFVLNNPSFLQRKAITDVKVEGNYGYDVSQYAHRFPIFKELTMPAGTILVTFRSYIDKLLRADRIGSAVCYQTSYYSFERFRGNVHFTDVTVDYLNDYERWMLNQDYSKTTIGIYVGSLRCIFNEAIEDGILKREKYPFGRRCVEAIGRQHRIHPGVTGTYQYPDDRKIPG